MKENITSLILAIACFVIAKAHFKGNVSSIHSYHQQLIYHIEEAGCSRYTTLKREYQHIHQEMEVLFQNEKTEI